MNPYFLEKAWTECQTFNTASKPISFIDIPIFIDSLMPSLQSSILAGEYHDPIAGEKIRAINTQLSNIATKFSNQPKSQDSPPNQAGDITEINNFLTQFDQAILMTYNDLIDLARGNIENYSLGKDPRRIKTNKTSIDALKKRLEDLNTIGYENLKIFEITVDMAILDETLECDPDTLPRLAEMVDTLDDMNKSQFNTRSVAQLKSKAEFLEYKINYRLNLEGKRRNSSFHPFPQLSPDNLYHFFKPKIITHYQELESQNEVISLQQQSQPLNDKGSWKLEPVYHLNRYYQKTTSTGFKERKKEIDRVWNSLDGIWEREAGRELSVYDQVAFQSAYNLLLNTHVNMEREQALAEKGDEFYEQIRDHLLGKKDWHIKKSEFLSSLLEQVNKVPKKTKLPEYRCFLNYLLFLNEVVERLITNTDNILFDARDIEDIETTISRAMDERLDARIQEIATHITEIYERTFSSLKANLSRAQKYHAPSVNMTYKECFTDDGWPDIPASSYLPGTTTPKLYLASSFILPTDFIQLNEDVKLYANSLEPKMVQLKDSIKISLNQIFLRNNLNMFTKRVKESELKVVQIIAMFVSIATFVLINVKIFDNKTGLESFAIILGLAACFFIFNLFFYFVILAQYSDTRGRWESLAKKLWFLIAPLSFAAASGYILYFHEGDQNKKMTRLTNQVSSDSLSVTRQTHMDSVLLDSLTKTNARLQTIIRSLPQ